ncbi:NAD(P)/FAD-dependent oxidoreductase [Rhizobacter sp. LjRoot28]|uniref:NAD(P)/FAD-dependent oxidoreductase n=1 Tax=Rhizobacter sp. LjRoot28 TaxID=3342309 RepID=UPI003ECD6F30
MNLPSELLPASCDVLVVGAGPAGSATAIELAREGLDVVLVDQHAFPRDKVCGDALIPDSHAALQRLGVLPEVMARAQSVSHVGCVAPRGGRVDVPGRLAVLPRKVLDALLCEAAVLAGARMYAPLRFVEPLVEFDRVVGARLRGRDAVRDVRCRWVVLATGAVPQALISAGVCERQLPSGIALRGYVRNPRMAGRIGTLDIVWHKALRPGYGWLFPCGEGLFNIGVGVAQSHTARPGGGTAKRGDVNLRDLFDTFTSLHAPARDLMADGEWEGELKGAPLRCSLTGAAFSRPGLLVTGEAAGSTYSFTGEGIGKALETGMLCAEAIIVGGDDDAMTRSDYASRLARLKPRFDLYERANQVNAHPWLADLLVWRARKNPRIVERMAGVLEETSNPGNLVSLRGVARLFTL